MKARNIVQTCFIVTLIAALGFQTSLPVQAGNFAASPRNLLLVPEAWVDDNYFNGGLNDGHTWGETAFATIQGGVNAVTPGGTVHVAAGTYHEDVQLNKSINLLGDPGDASAGPGPNAPTIGGCPTGISFCNGITFITTPATFSNVLIEGFIIRDHPRDIGVTENGGFGIRIKNETDTPMQNIIIRDNLFIDNRWEALMFFSIGSGAGMYFNNVSALNNRIENTSASATAWVGIECTNCRNSLIQGNIIEGKVEKGIWIASESTPSNPDFTNGQGLVVTGNTINGATQSAIDLDAFDINFGNANPVLSGVNITYNTLNRVSSVGSSQTSNLILIRHQTQFGSLNNITISNNNLDSSLAQQPAIKIVDVSQVSILNNTIHANSEIQPGEGGVILLNSLGLNNVISQNQITIDNGLFTPNDAIYLGGGLSGNITISQNTFTASGISQAAIRIAPSFSGTSDKTLEITNNRIVGFLNSLVFENSLDSHNLLVRTNSMKGNTAGLVNSLTTSLVLENNWWGCNAGPGQTGCDTYSGLVDANPWLVLTFAPGVTRVAPGASQVLTANLLFNSNGQDISSLGMDVASTTASFTASLGNFAPTSAPLSLGIASSLYTAPASPGIANICSQVDNQQVCKSLFIANHLLFLPSIVR